MPHFKYLAADATGKHVKGTLEATTVQDLVAKLEQKKLVCLQYEDTGIIHRPATTYRMSIKEVVIFCQQLETMLGAGITISRVFQVLCERASNPKISVLYRNIYECIQKGQTLSSAMTEQGRSFPPLLMSMIASGEASGTLDQVTRRMSTHFSNELKLNQKVRSAMLYPMLLLSVSLSVVVLLFTFVMPRLFVMFEGMELPAFTRFLVFLSELLTKRWYWIILGVFLLVALFKVTHRTESGRLLFDTIKVRIPSIGKLMKIIYTARFANSMASLYASGIPVIRALEISCEILDNRYYSQQFLTVMEQVSSGSSITSAATDTGLFDQMFLSLLFIGEESGTLEQVLEKSAEYYDREAQVALERMVALLEPALIVVLALVIGSIVAGTILPIYASYGQVGGGGI